MTRPPDDAETVVIDLDDPRCRDAARVGHKAANLAALRRLDDPLVVVPDGFAVPVDVASQLLGDPDPRDLAAVVHRAARRLAGDASTLLAVRSSGLDEDGPSSSGAGVHDSEIGVTAEDVVGAVLRCASSWHSARARAMRGGGPGRRPDEASTPDGPTPATGLAVLVQVVVRADHGRAGVAFSVAPDQPGADELTAGAQHLSDVVIEGVRGFGEQVVGGRIDPARARVSTRSSADGRREVDTLVGADPPLDAGLVRRVATTTLAVEHAMGHPVDVEWAVDDRDGQLHVVQARPIVPGPARAAAAPFTQATPPDGAALAQGIGIGNGVATGPVVVVEDPSEVAELPEGAVLVTQHTDPSWLPLMLVAGALVTDHGGALSHAAIVARELGLPAVVGCQDATTTLRGVDRVVVRCADGIGTVHAAPSR